MATKQPKSDPGRSDSTEQEIPHERQTESYAGGFIKARHGWVNKWLIVVYVVLLAWGVYYAVTYWGGLGPGLDY